MKKVIAAIILAALFLTIPFMIGGKKPAAFTELPDLSEKLLRLHVIANSDSEEDQELKRRVRDAIIQKMNGKFKTADSIEETKTIIRKNLDEIQAAAAKIVKKHGKNYPVAAELGTYPFPTRRYGIITLPAGEYQALRVVIGSGKGQNWWCVLFPPLCFIDITHGLTDERVKQELKKVLKEEEFRLVVDNANSGEIPIKIRFKILDVFKTIKMAGTKNLSNQIPPSPK